MSKMWGNGAFSRGTLVCLALLVYLKDSSCVTTNRREHFSQLPQRTGFSTNRNNQRTGVKVMDPSFENAGQVDGLEIWRIEDFKPVPYPKNQYGKFYTGDSYIILNTKTTRSGAKVHDLHFWLGAETSQDEQGSAAIYTVQLDEHLNGEPVQHRETQNHESQLFLSYFKSGGIRYLPGGVSSGFHHVDPNAFEKRLFQVKGSRNIRVKQVTPSIASMNTGDCFILDVGRDIYVYVGTKARRVEQLKAINAANQIRDQDHAGKAKVTIVDTYSPESDYTTFFEALGEGSRDSVPDYTTSDDDESFERTEENHASLYKVSDATGSVKVTKVGQKPLEASSLDPSDCFILDTTDALLYVWIGSKCDEREKKEAMNKADGFLNAHNHPKWTHVQRIVQGAEPTAFTQYFRNWQAFGETHPRLLRSVSTSAHLYHCQIRSRSRRLKVEEIRDYEQEDLWEDDIMVLDAGDVVFVWNGKGASDEEKSRGPKYVHKMLNRQGREDVPVKIIEQGDEPEEFTIHFPAWSADHWDNLPDVRSYIKNEED
ncbi:actin depolymerising venom protein gelsolin 1 [Diabrotica virgifera virgifera]|uniref:Gelsolin n=1 Tax=Diabrotica virgifera virgifera TaxID=50390 RepID=A0A6P7GJJ3_DIAVI|nr:actin depolymerising venom protein gelsolin 1 [Diabrotica virgifera virgifera]XP_050519607.1 actin depolymerising venom protein gelsolin 1 [Diabrotica virgifera virgifera]XP_050519608.1 actin depolymerising venom protein gelsolin 1 [Diabrotica virgifera virgifera]XP_050519609.1 actin depolymerising venom protein gelsolin 1 [Diabrotica virgifera virgifera]